MMKYGYVGLLLVTLLSFRGSAQLPQGTLAPEIKLPDSLGKWKPLSSVKSKLILLDFWAAWCGPCVQAMPDLKRLYTLYHSKGLEVYAVSLDRDYRNWVATCRRLELPFILVNDAFGLNGNSAHDYHIESIPNKMLIRDGVIIASEMSLHDLEKRIQDELN